MTETITFDLRRLAVDDCESETVWFEREHFDDLCDIIDSIHATLEAENDALRETNTLLMDNTVMVPTYSSGREVRVGDDVIYDKWPDDVCTVKLITLSDDPEHQWVIEILHRNNCIGLAGTAYVPTDGTVLTKARLGDDIRSLLKEFAVKWESVSGDYNGELHKALLDEYAELIGGES